MLQAIADVLLALIIGLIIIMQILNTRIREKLARRIDALERAQRSRSAVSDGVNTNS